MATFGIMTNRIGKLSRYTFYAKEAARIGFRTTLLFTPDDIRFEERTISALCYADGRWNRRICRYPSVAHDTGFYTDKETIRIVKRFKSISGVPFTGYGLGNKWQIHRRLQRSEFAGYIPETALMKDPLAAIRMLQRHHTVMIKPVNGKQGRGIVKLSLHPKDAPKPYLWQDGSSAGQRLTREETISKLRRCFRPSEAIVQRWMDIRDPYGHVFDIRALVQKAPDGSWQLTEMGIRLGHIGHIASNVARGGSVKNVHTYLPALYGEAAAERIIEECETIAAGLPQVLEQLYGKPFIELGIDLAVERGGSVRLIEVNIKPGKKIVRELSGKDAYADALLRPIRYALRLSDRVLQTRDS